MTPFAPRMSRIEPSPASRRRAQAQAIRAAGRDVIALTSGDLDFPTPDHVIAAAHAATLRGDTKYSTVDGTAALKDAVRVKFRRENDLDYTPDEVIVANGSTQIIFNAFFATVAAGDEVIVPTPCWASYVDQVRLADGDPVAVPCLPQHGFRLRLRISRPRSRRGPAGWCSTTLSIPRARSIDIDPAPQDSSEIERLLYAGMTRATVRLELLVRVGTTLADRLLGAAR